MERPILSKQLNQGTFRSFYYRKEELVDFCRKNGLPTSGGKIEITDRIAHYLETGKITEKVIPKKVGNRNLEMQKQEMQNLEVQNLATQKQETLNLKVQNLETQNIQSKIKATNRITEEIFEDTQIEPNFICSEKHRAFFKEHIGKSFTFNVAFQKWLKANTGKTYSDAISAYKQILQEKKKGKTTIDPQFEYNTYIRDFFADNDGIHNEKRSLKEAIQCWNYKKQLQGCNTYQRTDLDVLLGIGKNT